MECHGGRKKEETTGKEKEVTALTGERRSVLKREV